jgi:hypothetical protein
MSDYTLPCITVKAAIESLSKLPPGAKLHAWLPGTYMPVACVIPYTMHGKALLEVNLPLGVEIT